MLNIKDFSSYESDLLSDKKLIREPPSLVTGGNIQKIILDAPKSEIPKLQHPLEEKISFKTTIENIIQMRKKVGGTGQSEKFIQDLAAASKINRGPPGFSNSSRLHFDMLLGRDEKIGFCDYINYDYDEFF